MQIILAERGGVSLYHQKKVKHLAVVILFIISLTGCAAADNTKTESVQQQEPLVDTEFFAMNTYLTFQAYGDQINHSKCSDKSYISNEAVDEKKSGGITYLGLAVVPATWYNKVCF